VDLATAQTQLANVNAAISAAEAAQSYSGNGRAKTMANLETLYRRQSDLYAVINRMTGSAPSIVRGVVAGIGEDY
jgi:predicted transcriptional regulator with HTH domain